VARSLAIEADLTWPEASTSTLRSTVAYLGNETNETFDQQQLAEVFR